MKKSEQAAINAQALEGVRLIKDMGNVVHTENLYFCNAKMVTTDKHLIVLYSYATPVAVIDANNGNFYDVLRYTYGYTSTSAQHIAKFRNKYRVIIGHEYRYYPI